MERSFDPERHADLMANEEYRKGYLEAERFANNLPHVPIYEFAKLAFVFLGYHQLNTDGMAYRYWELGGLNV